MRIKAQLEFANRRCSWTAIVCWSCVFNSL